MAKKSLPENTTTNPPNAEAANNQPDINTLINNCISLIYHAKTCAENSQLLNGIELSLVLESALANIRPQSDSNLG